MEALNAHDGKELACITEIYLLNDKGERISREPWTVNYADSEEEVTRLNCSADKLFDLQKSTW